MKFAYVTSISPGYMFSLNANFNTNKYYGTNADFIVLYSHMDTDYEIEYMKKCSESFPFKIEWRPLGQYSHCFHNSKYMVAQTLEDYDAICLIDSDLFICCDTLQYFERAAKENVLITATHMWSGGLVESLPFHNPESLIDRGQAQLADFPVFINPKFGKELFKKWYDHTEEARGEASHPLVSFNRAIVKYLKKEQIVDLSGEQWVCDQNYWDYAYEVEEGSDGKKHMVSTLKGPHTPVYAIHNKWWKVGRASGEWIAHRMYTDPDSVIVKNLDRGEKNFNTIKDFMGWFNDLTPKTKRIDFNQDKIDRRAYVANWFKDNPTDPYVPNGGVL